MRQVRRLLEDLRASREDARSRARLSVRWCPRWSASQRRTLLGGARLHMLPEAVDAMGDDLDVDLSLVGGFRSFSVLEQLLHRCHCHAAVGQHEPLGHLILVADGVHKSIGSSAVAGAFLVDTRVGVVTWVARKSGALAMALQPPAGRSPRAKRHSPTASTIGVSVASATVTRR